MYGISKLLKLKRSLNVLKLKVILIVLLCIVQKIEESITKRVIFIYSIFSSFSAAISS